MLKLDRKNVLAKFSEKTGKKQTLSGHTIDCLKILRCYFEKNEVIIEVFCKRWNIDKQTFMRNLFVAVYLHDIGKLTKEFQKRISEGKHSQQYPHAFYGFPIVWEVFKKQFQEFVYSDEPLIETLSVLAHHTQLYDGIYENAQIKEVDILKNEIIEFVNGIEKVYESLSFKKFFELRWNNLQLHDLKSFALFERNPQHKIPNGIRRLREKIENLKGNNLQKICALKSIYTSFLSILKLCDYYASVEFSEYACKDNTEKEIFDDVLKKPEKYVLSLPSITEDIILRKHKPYEFQKEIKEKSPEFCFLFAPCGRGKTEAALLWAFEVCKKYNKNKIIFAMPTQTTSNAMRDRFVELLESAGLNGEEYVGLYHGKSFIKFKEERVRDQEEEKDELSDEDIEEIKGENFKGNIFFKPITITTIDHLILSFVHGFPQADFALGNLQNAVIIFDEVHYYETQTLKHLVDLFKILRKMRVPHLLMSGTLPDFLIERINKDSKEENIKYELIKDKIGLQYTPFKIEKYKEPLITKENVNEKVIEEIIKNFKIGYNQFIILNTVERSQRVYKILKEKLKKFGEKYVKDIFLLHSQFTYRDRTKKEKEILNILNKKRERPVILVATQIIEISLDISCDIMYTELAPIDAIGQRGGRINRGNKNWRKNKKEYIIKVFEPEKEYPYDKEIIKNTKNILTSDVYSYLKLKLACDKVYKKDYLEIFEESWASSTNRQPLLSFDGREGVFEETCLFGLHHSDMVYINSNEEKGKALIIRPEKQQKFDVIPEIYYKQKNENALIEENLVKIPLWWIKEDEKKHGRNDLQWFYMHIVNKNGKKRVFWICKLDYSEEYGFDTSKLESFSEDFEII